MNVICISLRGNMKCGCKVDDVARLPEKKSSSHSEELMLKINEFNNPPTFSHHYNRNRFLELEIGDPSRNVIEMIFRACSTNPRKCRKKIKRVIKVNNPVETLSKFEKYRERVIISSHNYEQQKRHPRSTVDGNEVLQFYGTTINCCPKNTSSTRVSEPCRDPCCRVCRIVQSGFSTSYNKINGIRLSRKSERMSEDVHVSGKGKHVKKAVIVCRTITGLDDGRFEGDCCEYSYGGGFCRKSDESMVVRNPAAVLPCFVIVF